MRAALRLSLCEISIFYLHFNENADFIGDLKSIDKQRAPETMPGLFVYRHL